MENWLCLLLLNIAVFQTVDAIGCYEEDCDADCIRSGRGGGYCSSSYLYGVCKCRHDKCIDSECLKDCVRKPSGHFQGGRCHWGVCKCETQSYRRWSKDY